MKKQNARVNYFFGDIYSDSRDLIFGICKKILKIVETLYAFILGLITNSLSSSWDVIKDVFENWSDSIGEPWEGVGDAFDDFKDELYDLFHPDGFLELIAAFFKALFYVVKLGFFLSYFLVNLILTPVICFVFTVMFLAVEIAILAVLAVAVAVVSVVLFVCIALITGVCYIGIGFIALGIGIAFITMAFLDFMYRRIHKLFSGCPHCQEKFDLPVYVCDCGLEQTRLIPSKYGILKRKCLCGRKLPTTFFNGRQKLHSRCPKCGYDSIAGGVHTEVWIPVIGGPSAGKTCYINMAITKIGGEVSSKYGLDFTYHKQGDDMYDENKEIMEKGLLPQKTSDMSYKFYQFNLAHKGSKIGNLISICDVAGELYAEKDDFDSGSAQGGFKQADGFILIIDPLSIRDYRAELEQNSDFKSYDYGASDKPMDEIISIIFNTVENLQNKTNSKIKPSCAIVFTKCDIPGLDEVLGETAIENYISANGGDRFAATNAICEAFLKQYESNFLSQIKQRFTSYQFFTCSALGHNADGSEFVPVHVEDGVLWVLDKCCHSLNFYKNGAK